MLLRTERASCTPWEHMSHWSDAPHPQVCRNALDALCFVANRCWGRFGGFLGIVGGVTVALGALALAAKAGAFAPLLGALGAQVPCLGGGGGGWAEEGHPQAPVQIHAPVQVLKRMASPPAPAAFVM